MNTLNDSEYRPQVITESSTDADRKQRKDFIMIPLRGAAELRKKIKWSNDNYHFTYPPNTTDPKGYYLYGVLNEVDKAVLSVMQAYEFVADSRAAGVPKETDEEKQIIADNIFQSRIDELALWQRKMTELMVELRGFQSANTTEYYRHYLTLYELQSLRRSQADLKEYYDVANENYAFQERELIQELDSLVTKLDPARCWYAIVEKGSIKNRSENFERRFQYAFKKMKVYERATLRTQHLSFGSQSKSIHVGASAGERQLSLDSIEAHAARVVSLAIHVVVMAKDLMHIQNTKGWLKMCADVVKKNDYPVQIHAKRTNPDIQAGDFVVVSGSLAQVVKVKISEDYRYKSFRIRYLELPPPLPNIFIDEVPGDWVRLLYKRKPLVEKTIAAIRETTPSAKPTTREINKLLKEGVIAGWSNGLKETVLNRPGDGRQRFERFQETMKAQYEGIIAQSKQFNSAKPDNLTHPPQKVLE